MTKGKPEPFWPTSWPVPSILGSHDRWLALQRHAANAQGGERMSLRPHWTPRG
jgi:hypothetical protein